MSNICNQIMKEEVEPGQIIALCVFCKEESNAGQTYPMPIGKFTGWLKNFTDLHTSKGCNEHQLLIDLQT